MKNNELVVVHESIFKKILNKIKSIFGKKETPMLEKGQENEPKEIKEKKDELIEKLSKLKREQAELEKKYEIYFEKLKNVRVEELKLTLKIYQMEEFYLKKIKEDKLNMLR